jgi:tetratricopeptide (TPR) repeat protein
MSRPHQPRPGFCRNGVVAVLLFLGILNQCGAQEAERPALLPETPPVESATPSGISSNRLEQIKYALATARFSVNTRDFKAAEKNFLLVLAEDSPEDLQKTALFEMGAAVQLENDLPRAQSIFTQYQQRWGGDARTPEVCLHEGQIFRAMGMNQLALAKFFSVMTAALTIKDDQIAYYKRIVLQAKVEIAETHYLIGKFAEAAEFYSRLLKEESPELDYAQIQFRLIRSLVALQHYDEAATQSQDFLAHHAAAPEAPEIRYHLAQALKGLGRNNEALQQVLVFLKEEREKTKERPEVWTYWQQRVGNEIGNALYQEGDYVKALEIYLTLAKLDSSPAWQLPVTYQVGITYEKLLQTAHAIEAYRTITNAAPQLGTNTAPGLKAVAEMAQWRLDFLQFHDRATGFTHLPDYVSTNAAPNLSKE